MKFQKQKLLELLELEIGDEKDGYTLVVHDIAERSRWNVYYRLIFKYDTQYFETCYRVGATEQQDESPWEFDKDEIECTEVFPKEKTIIVYES